MFNKLNFLNIAFELLYLIIPFFILPFFAGFSKFKDKNFTRKFSNTFFASQLVFSFFMFLLIDKYTFTIFDVTFLSDRLNLALILILNFIYLLFSIFSKEIIKTSSRIFYPILIIFFALSNVFILTDNVFLLFLIIFWTLLLQYLLLSLYKQEKNLKKNLNRQLIFDFVLFFASVFLIGFDFLRYFILNQINFSFENIQNYLSNINETSTILAFVGFLILIFRHFNFIVFSGLNFSNYKKVPAFNLILLMFFNSVVAHSLFVKIYPVFSFLFNQYSETIITFLFVNLIYYLILMFKTKTIGDFLLSSYVFNMAIGINLYLISSKNDLRILFYYFISFIVSFVLLGLVFSVLETRFNTNLFEEFKKIPSKNNIFKTAIIFSILNYMKLPFLSNFMAFLILVYTAVSKCSDISINILIVFFVAFLFYFVSNLNIFYKILLFPYEKFDKDKFVSRHQSICILLLIFLVVILIFLPLNLFSGHSIL